MANFYLSPVSAVFQWFTDAGIPLIGGKINTYAAGTSTPAPTYTDITGGTTNGNPIKLDGAGRLPNVQIWQAQGVAIKIVVTDAGGNQLGPPFDQIYGINDPTAILAALAAQQVGATLIANAVYSYQLFSNLRAAGVPVLAGSQTLMVMVEGGDTIGDAKAGIMYWSASASAADDDNNTIAPTGAGSFGRFLRLPTAGLPTLVSAFGALTMTAGGLIYGTSASALAVLPVGSDGANLVLTNGVPTWQGATSGAGVGTLQVQELASDVVCGSGQTAVFTAIPTTASAMYSMYAEIDGVVAGSPTLATVMTSDQSGTITQQGSDLGWVLQESSGVYVQIVGNAAYPGISGRSLYNNATNLLQLRGRFLVDSSTTSVTFSVWCGSGASPSITCKAGAYIQLVRIK